MINLAIIFGPVLTAYILALIFAPYTTVGDVGAANASNNLYRIKMSNKPSKKSDPFRAAIWLQEFGEVRHKLTNPLAMFRQKSALQKMELMGHEVEVQGAILLGLISTKKEITAYRNKEARSIIRYAQFKNTDWTVKLIEQAMRDNTSKANKFARKHLSKAKKHLPNGFA